MRMLCSRTLALLMISVCSCATGSDLQVPFLTSAYNDVLVVGVRENADPFSYRTASRSNAPIIRGYSGYMVEICRRVFSDLVKDGYFNNYRVITKKVTAKDRFSKLDTYSVDMLCGPDSITQERLEYYNASHPVFLSGVTLVSRPAEDFPRKKYCNAIVGMVEGTTASHAGLKRMAELDEVRRFKPALVSFLAKHSASGDHYFTTSFNQYLERWINSHGASSEKVVKSDNGFSPIPSDSVVTDECPDGYNEGPVVYYKNHDEGVNDFCNNKTLFYLGDKDLLRSKFDALPACKMVFGKTTLTREAYGIYFRKASTYNNQKLTKRDIRDAMLYAHFNNILLRKMQESESILEHEYKQQFSDQQQGTDLIRFFDSFKYANQF